MKVFVASWFFPPSTSSEGIVTYKLLRHSSLRYDVVCSSSNQWGYARRIETKADNVNVISVKTDSLTEWRDETIRIFREKYKTERYGVVMTRCMPNESLEVGLAIKKEFPSVKWICSLADPVANNPYWINAIQNIAELSDSAKSQVVRELGLPREKWTQDWLKHPSNSVRDQFYWKDIQDQSLKQADMIVTPSIEQRDYMDPDKTAQHKFLIVPHSYDEELYEQASYDRKWEEGKVHFAFTGYSDQLRSIRPFVDAVRWISIHYPAVLSRLKIHFVGNYPRDIIDRANAYDVQDAFDFTGNVSYLETLAIMKRSDWLLHVDAWFASLAQTGGSIFFAGKLADYMGAGKPILALTGKYSPADNIVDQYGGVVCLPWETTELARQIVSIVLGETSQRVNDAFRRLYDARQAAADFDIAVEKMTDRVEPQTARQVVGSTAGDKALTVCVPSYNAQKTLRRTLDSLLAVKQPEALEVIVIDDGSADRTADIGREYVGRYPASVVLVSKPNGGHGSGINEGLNLARGRYFRVVDSDDWVDANALSEELDYIVKTASGPDVIYTPYHIVDQSSGDSYPWPQSEKIKNNRVYAFEDLAKAVGVENFYFTMAGTSFRTELLKNMKLSLREKSFYTDSAFILKPIPYVRTAVFLPRPVYKYLRGQAEQSVAPLSFVRHYADHEAIVRELIQYEKSTKMGAAQRKYMKHILRQHLITNYTILLEYDQDTKTRMGKVKKFDKWLKENAESYYKWTEENVLAARLARKAAYDEEMYQLQKEKYWSRQSRIAGGRNSLLARAVHSPLLLNRHTMGFMRRQKDNNGLIYRLYMKLK